MKKQFSVLTVDDMPDQLKRMKKFLLEDFPDSDVLFGKEQPRILCAKDGEKALQILKEKPDINVILSDLVMPPTSTGGFWLAQKVFFEFKDRPMFFFLISDKQQLHTVTKTEPWKNLEKELAKRTRRDQILLYAYKPWAELKGDIVSEFFKYMRRGLVRVIEDFDEKHFFVESRRMRELVEMAKQAAGSDYPVLITGETGVGKEEFAKLIHNNSPRKSFPMKIINMTAFPDTLLESELFGHQKGAFTGAVSKKVGQFELSKGGALFLDEIGEVSLKNQVKLLRAVQEGVIAKIGEEKDIRVDCRIIAATKKDLQSEVYNGSFREDLFYRLNVLHLVVPPLRERREEIPRVGNCNLLQGSF